MKRVRFYTPTRDALMLDATQAINIPLGGAARQFTSVTPCLAFHIWELHGSSITKGHLRSRLPCLHYLFAFQIQKRNVVVGVSNDDPTCAAVGISNVRQVSPAATHQPCHDRRPCCSMSQSSSSSNNFNWLFEFPDECCQ